MGAACQCARSGRVMSRGNSDLTALEVRSLLQRKASQQNSIGFSIPEDLESDWVPSYSSESIYTIYKKLETVGSGYSGEVSKACLRDNSDRLYAIKSVLKGRLNTRSTRYFKGELDVLKEIDHPNIVRFYECYQDPQAYHVVLEFCEGGDLVSRVEKSRGLPEALAKKFIFQAMYAINYLHQIGIAHRDVKLDNFLLTSKDDKKADLKLIDFGFSRHYKRHKLKSNIGTAWYAAPEVLVKNAEYGPMCDNWALGVMLYLMLVGDAPFKGSNNQEIFDQVQTKDPMYNVSPFEDINPEVVKIVKGLLTKDPNERMQLSTALQSTWFSVTLAEIYKIWDKPTKEAMVKKLKSAQPISIFKKEVLKLIVRNYPDSEEVVKKTRKFMCCDYLNNGLITEGELKCLFEEVGESSTAEQYQQICNNISITPGKIITYTDFLAALLDKKFFEDTKRLKLAFERFDTEGCGVITEVSMRACFGRFGYKLEEDLAKQFIQDFDIDKDGAINFDEFQKKMTNN